MNVGDTTDAAALGPDSRRTVAYVISKPFGVTQALVNLVNQRPSFAVYTTFHHRQLGWSKSRSDPALRRQRCT
jgi:hypothetical protein